MWKIFKLSSGNGSLPITSEWIGELSADRYLPMTRLLDDSDMEFLSRQTGFDSKMATRLRIQRCHIFGCYLSSLNQDFGQCCHALKLLMIHSTSDRPDLALLLLRKQIMFRLCMLRARWRLALYSRGIGCVDVACLMRLFDSVCLELQGLAHNPERPSGRA